MNVKRQSKTEKRNSEEAQTDSPEICYSPSSINKEEILSKYLRIETGLLALNSHVKCELLYIMRKME